jgi:hypothetical protein
VPEEVAMAENVVLHRKAKGKGKKAKNGRKII